MITRGRLIALEADVFRALSQHSDLDLLLRSCVEALVKQLGAVMARIWLLNGEPDILFLVASAGEHTLVNPAFHRIRVGQYRIGRIAACGTSVIVNDWQSEPSADDDWALANEIGSFAGHPMLVEGRVEGVLAVFGRKPISRAVATVLQRLADGLAQAVARLRSQDALRESEKQMQRVIEGSNDGFWDWHVPSGRVHFSARWASMLGYDLDAVPPTIEGFTRLVHPDDLSVATARLEAYWAGAAAAYELELRMLTRCGRWHWILARGKVGSWLAPGQPEMMTGTHVDIHARKVAEERFKGVFETMHDGYLTADLAGSLTLANPAAADLLGYANTAELLEVDPQTLFVSEQEWNAILVSGQGTRQRATLRRKDGALRLFEGSARTHAGTNGDRPFVAILFRDVTQEAHTQSEGLARIGAEESNRLKSRFLARMSHELRTPLNSVLGMTHLALETQLDPQQRHYLEEVQRSGRALLAIVHDLLDFADIDNGQLQLHSADFRMAGVLQRTVSAFERRAQEKGLALVVEVENGVPSVLTGDAGRLSQVLDKLVGNAVKFTDTGEVRISVRGAAPAEGGTVKLAFTVRDTGVGLTPDLLGGLFASFSQVDSSPTRKHGGMGLGLALCQRLIRLMNGEIEVHSQPGQGTMFTFTALFGSRACEPVAPSTQAVFSPHSENLELLSTRPDAVLAATTRLRALLESADGSARKALQELQGLVPVRLSRLEQLVSEFQFDDALMELGRLVASDDGQ